MLPFDSYPNGGRRLRELDLFADYHRWLLLPVDHVVPAGVARGLEIPAAIYEDAINLVLACAGCNGFDNRYT